MRVLVAARLSQLADGQTGLDTQDAEARSWALANGHEIVHVAADRKSGRSQPWDRENLKPWVTEPDKIALYDAVVASRLDRLSRGDKRSTNAIEAWAHQHGKRLLTTDGLVFPCEGSDGIRWDLAARLAHQEWLTTSERYRRMQGYLRDQGKLVGRPPWGLEVAPAEGGHKTLVPSEEGREYVPRIYERVIAGDSLGDIARWLETETGRAWWPSVLAGMIKNPAYRGHRQDASGRTILRCEPLVSAATWRAANEALAGRPKRGPAVAANKAMLSGAIYCGSPDCTAGPDSPMYRIWCGSAHYYRCSGRGTNRRGCGTMVRLETADRVFDGFASAIWAGVRVTVTSVIPGTDHAAELEEVADEIRQLALRDLDDAEYDAELARLRTERDRLRSLPVTPDSVQETELSESYADRWEAAPVAQRGAWLRSHGFRIALTRKTLTLSQPGRPGGIKAVVELA